MSAEQVSEQSKDNGRRLAGALYIVWWWSKDGIVRRLTGLAAWVVVFGILTRIVEVIFVDLLPADEVSAVIALTGSRALQLLYLSSLVALILHERQLWRERGESFRFVDGAIRLILTARDAEVHRDTLVEHISGVLRDVMKHKVPFEVSICPDEQSFQTEAIYVPSVWGGHGIKMRFDRRTGDYTTEVAFDVCRPEANLSESQLDVEVEGLGGRRHGILRISAGKRDAFSSLDIKMAYVMATVVAGAYDKLII